MTEKKKKKPGVVLFEIPGWIPSRGNDRHGHWAQRHRLDKQWQGLTYALAHSARAGAGWEIASKGEEGVRLVEITMYRPRLLDTDNLYRTAKPVIDGLKKVLIYDDRPSSAVITVTQQRLVAPGHPRIVVEVREQDPARLP